MPNQFPPESPRISEAARQFLDYARVELQFGAQTIEKYGYCLQRLQRSLGDRPVTEITAEDVTKLKSEMLARGNGVCWQVIMLAAAKRLLQFCQQRLGLLVLEPSSVMIPKRPRREVVYLTVDEVERFVRVIPETTSKNRPHHPGLRFRALVEVLLGSAMRIGEVLSLDRANVDFERKEARVIGKGNKQRTVFFTDRALHWLGRYLEIRTDDGAALFISQTGTRLDRTDIWRPFARYRLLAGLNKPVTGQPEGEDYLFFGFVAGPNEFRQFRLSELEAVRGLFDSQVERDPAFSEGRLTDVVPAPDS